MLNLSYDEWGKLVYCDDAGVRHVGVVPVRGFPISDPDHWISICNADGKELLNIRDFLSLPDEIRALLDRELAAREFIPVVKQVIKVYGHAEPCEWDVVTDRGRVRFVLKSEDDIRRLGSNRALIIDAKGVRYLVPEIDRLDTTSRRIVDRYL